MIECPECKWDYPSITYLHLIVINGRSVGPVCGICALEIGNRIHGMSRDKFDGELAEEIRQKALRWRELNPKYGPKDTKK